MMDKEYPEEGELIVGTVTKVQGFGAFVSLDEFPDKEGFIHISEIATGWVKRIRNYVREKQKVVCKVMRVDTAKKHIDLSLKRVNEHQRRDKIQEWKNSQKARKLFEMVATSLGKPVEDCTKEFGNDLVKTYGSLYESFEECAYDPEGFKEEGFDGDWFETFYQIAQDNISIPFVEIKGMITITSWLPDGIAHIRQALTQGEEGEYEDVTIEIKYIGAPRYLITVKAPDYKIAEEEMKKAVERAETYIKEHDGELVFKRELGE
jgi:translation initiation factor 2 subunit 1